MTAADRTVDAGSFPKVILLDTTNFCNLKCSMCGHRLMTRKQGKMGMELYRKIIDEIASEDRHIRVWVTFFGESLILQHRLYWQILYAKYKGLTDVVLNSNGTLLDEEASKCVIESGLDGIYIGIDAFKPETYNKIRVGGDYQKTVANVNRLLEMKSELHSPLPKVFVQFVEMRENCDEIADFTKYWTERGASVKIRPKVTWAGTVDPYDVKQTNEQRYPCYWAMRTFNVCWDGRVVLCSVDYDAKLVAGDLSNKKETIKSIWGNKLHILRKYQQRGWYDEMPEFCQNCTDWQMATAEYH
jgi:MoaA/NifB/PqqE/SkfB family radical SAM enzyme